MAFERDFVLRFQEEGRNVLIKYHKALKQANLDMVPNVKDLIQVGAARPGDDRYHQHFLQLAKQEENNMMRLIAPPEKGDYEILNLPPSVAAEIYKAYSIFNAAKTDMMRASAPAQVIEHCEKVTRLLDELAEQAAASTGRVGIPIGLLNLGYEATLSEANPQNFERVAGHPM